MQFQHTHPTAEATGIERERLLATTVEIEVGKQVHGMAPLGRDRWMIGASRQRGVAKPR
jgi:hypothetical protein